MINHPNRSKTRPTPAQVRAHYQDQGYEVRIAKDGHVTYRKDGGEWLEGRWVSEHRLVDGSVVLV